MAVETCHDLPESLEQLLVLEREVECEWWWLGGALHAVAQVQAEAALGNLRCFREMQAQARTVDRRRVEIALRIAKLEVARSTGRPCADCESAPMAPHQPEQLMEVSCLNQGKHAQSE